MSRAVDSKLKRNIVDLNESILFWEIQLGQTCVYYEKKYTKYLHLDIELWVLLKRKDILS